MAEKMGLRTRPNTPAVTSEVRACTSTPMRQDSPIVSCATTVRTMPRSASSVPAIATGPLSRRSIRSSPARSAIGAATSSASDAVNRPAASSSLKGAPRLGTRKPVDPVLRHCSHDRHPNASRRNAASSTIAVHARVIGSAPPRRDAGAAATGRAAAERGCRPASSRSSGRPGGSGRPRPSAAAATRARPSIRGRPRSRPGHRRRAPALEHAWSARALVGSPSSLKRSARRVASPTSISRVRTSSTRSASTSFVAHASAGPPDLISA